MPHGRGSAIVASFISIASAVVLAASADAATFDVTRTDDPAPGACRANDCSLREAVMAANETGANDTVSLGRKTYELTQPGDTEDDGETGDLDIAAGLTLKGKGVGSTAIRAAWPSGEDRMIDVLPANRLAVSGLTFRDGDDGIYTASGIHVREPDSPDSAPASLVLANVDFSSMDNGYAVDNLGKARLSRVRFIDNNATQGCCAGFYNEPGSTVRMTNVEFTGNQAGADTGAMYSDGDKAILKNVTFSDNTAGSVGGALIATGDEQTLTNVTFVGNESETSGGGLEVESVGSLLLNNVTFTENVADSDGDESGNGGGLHVSGGPLTLQNTIVAGNVDASPSGDHPDCSGSVTSTGFNLFGVDTGCDFSPATGDASGSAATPLDAMLGPLGDNGGFVPTAPLEQGSPAINRGSPAEPGGNNPHACAAKDARNVKRPQGPRCDKGAYERKR